MNNTYDSILSYFQQDYVKSTKEEILKWFLIGVFRVAENFYGLGYSEFLKPIVESKENENLEQFIEFYSHHENGVFEFLRSQIRKNNDELTKIVKNTEFDDLEFYYITSEIYLNVIYSVEFDERLVAEDVLRDAVDDFLRVMIYEVGVCNQSDSIFMNKDNFSQVGNFVTEIIEKQADTFNKEQKSNKKSAEQSSTFLLLFFYNYILIKEGVI